MKTTSLIVLIVLKFLVTHSALGQASFALRNIYFGIDAPVFDQFGVPLAGTNYLAELWGAATPGSLVPLVVLDEGNIRKFVPLISPGYFVSGESSLSVLTVPPYGWAWLQLRAWDTRLGATYEEVAALGLGGYGESPLFYAQGNNPRALLPEPPAPLIGLQSFSLRAGKGVLIRRIFREGNQVVLEWNPGFQRYQLQQTTALGHRDRTWAHPPQLSASPTP